MAKKKGISQQDLRKILGKAKESLRHLGEETKVWMKKGELELSRLSKIGKLELGLVNLNMQKDRLLKDIGKRVVERNLGNEIDDSAIRQMCDRVNVITKASTKKRREISKIGKDLLKVAKKTK